ncbi:BatA domain-containing protein [Pedobacter metabolipauper]|uniref:Putative membrane protein (TIGR02226 family) n=1 Tax=Pedobacter metabolipauper TaxID=425513 RepID=A0A4R6STU8_9SPHI|nr:BatA domain-containing protein [Pedobacter metabolipauper]TDQ08386.1 putative membrane protein (TIGR02226 family) [Pedobacter metabolipauper]
MQLLYPIGLLALLALIVPVIIHLWNVKQGKTLKIGSIALLGAATSLSSRSIRVTDWFLLMLRCMLLILLAFMLAGPYLKADEKSDKKGWVLIERPQLPQVYKHSKTTIDSLLKAGYELHEFESGFGKMNLNDTLTVLNADTIKTRLGYSSLLKQLNTELPAGMRVYLYADRRLANLNTDLPAITYHLIWKNIPASTDTVSKWTTKHAGKIFNAQSTPSFTSYQPAASNTDTSGSIKVMIFDGGNSADAKYVKAALAAMASFTRRNITVKDWRAGSAVPINTDLVFWLSDQPVNPGLQSALKKTGKLFTYEKGKIIGLNSTIKLNIQQAGNRDDVSLTKRIFKDRYSGTDIWLDGYGDPLLSLERKDNVLHYHFYSRFNPQWTELVWNSQFVDALMPLVIGNERVENVDHIQDIKNVVSVEDVENGESNSAGFAFETHPSDQRVLSNEQPEMTKLKEVPHTVKHNRKEPVSCLFWVAAFVIFAIERIVSLKKKTKISYD